MSILFYKASERFAQFAGHPEGIALEVEAAAPDPAKLEVRAQAAVAPSRDGDELALKDMRIAFAVGRGRRLDEREVLLAVACEHARVILSHSGPAVACQDGF